MVTGQSDMSTRFLTALAFVLALIPLSGSAAPLANQLFGVKDRKGRQQVRPPFPAGVCRIPGLFLDIVF